MTNEQILTKVIQKAIDGGFYSFADGLFGNPEFVISGGVSPEQDFMRGGFRIQVKDWPPEDAVSIERIIFSHDFAKALWGDQIVTDLENKYDYLGNPNAVIPTDHEPSGTDYDYPVWMWHLQQAVVSEDPVSYMYKAVFGNEVA